jgi:membrane protein DedA with SNARE-associated domain
MIAKLLANRISETHRMSDEKYQIIGLLGFIVAGFIFIAVGVNFGDKLTIAGSVVWVISCLIWLIPLVRKPKG